MKSENYKKIAEIINRYKIHGEVACECIAKDLADIYEEEDNKLQKKSEELKRHPKRKLQFNKTQFLKDCGVQ